MIHSKKVMFDIGAAGPIAGFVASIIVLIYGFTHLPSRDFILAIHPDYNFILNSSAGQHTISLAFGDTLLFSSLRQLLASSSDFIPPMSEIYHYPFLCAGWFGLLVTALNLIPIGQFDGGHILYAMFGERHKTIARISLYMLLALSIPSISDAILRVLLQFAFHHEYGQIVPLAEYSWSAWFFWALIALYIVKLYHPPIEDETPLDKTRQMIGWCCICIFVLSFSFLPFTIG
jgi:membrane-associated protease RseP (regulator of RpoE activity)